MRLVSISWLLLSLLLLVSTPALSAWSDWWFTPEQKAAQALERGDFETLQKNAPTADWRGFGEYGAGNYESAADTFGKSAANHTLDGDESAARHALYNQGVSQVRNGQYQEAIDSFGEVLNRDPAFADAEHNQSIARQLLELQQQEKQDQQSGEQDSSKSDDGQQNEQSEDGEEQPSENSEQSESSDGQPSESQNNEESDSADQQAGGTEQQPAEDGASESGNAEQDQRDAEQALAAEAARDRQEDEKGE